MVAALYINIKASVLYALSLGAEPPKGFNLDSPLVWELKGDSLEERQQRVATGPVQGKHVQLPVKIKEHRCINNGYVLLRRSCFCSRLWLAGNWEIKLRELDVSDKGNRRVQKSKKQLDRPHKPTSSVFDTNPSKQLPFETAVFKITQW